MNFLCPRKVNNYDAIIQSFKKQLEADKIDLSILKDIPYKNQEGMPAASDLINMYIAVRYLVEGKKTDKKVACRDFLEKDDEFKSFVISAAQSKATDKFKDIEIDVVKGSIYKIKKYFLENSKIKDIRGGSYIIDYLNVDKTKEILREKEIEECIVYAGGGNVILILPKGHGQELSRIFEEEYTKTALTCMNAFESLTVSLNEFFLNFKEVSRKINDKLEERKKLKVYPINPISDLEKIDDIKITYEKIAPHNKECSLCNTRDAHYTTKTSEGDICVCSSCLRKTTVGARVKGIFINEFENKYKVQLEDIKTLKDIKDDRGYVAVIYGDGNNMGNVVMNIKTPFEMMYFSRKLDEITRNSVYDAIYDVLGKQSKFEVIALGGDDVFIIVPADRSLEISNKIIKNFDSAFNGEITMSVGICISKHNTPIRNMFEISQGKLKSAKKITRNSNVKCGSVDLIVLESNDIISPKTKNTKLFPMLQNEFDRVINVVKNMKNDKDIKRSQLYKLRYAANTLEDIEFEMYYLYQEARLTKKYTEFLREIFKNQGTFGGLITKEKEKISPWNDIVNLLDYIGGEK